MAKKQVVIAGGETLLGRELESLIDERKAPFRARLLSSASGSLVLNESEDQPLMGGLEAEHFTGAEAVLLACDTEPARRVLDLVRRMGQRPLVIDAGAALEDSPGARLFEPGGEAAVKLQADAIYCVPHAAAITLNAFLAPLHTVWPVARSIAQVFVAASEQGREGVEELRKQTVSLLSFQKVPKKVFDAQLGFNLLPDYGLEAPRSLEDTELRVERHLASLLAAHPGAPMPSVRVAQAPVFHGVSVSLWLEGIREPNTAKIFAELSGQGVDVRGPETDAPSNVGAAGLDGFTAGSFRRDRNNNKALWCWLVADNLRVTAGAAINLLVRLAGAGS